MGLGEPAVLEGEWFGKTSSSRGPLGVTGRGGEGMRGKDEKSVFCFVYDRQPRIRAVDLMPQKHPS